MQDTEKRPGIISRARLALGVFNRGLPVKRQQLLREKGKGPILAWPDFMTDRPQWHLIDAQAFIDEGFTLNSLIYSAIMYKIRASYSAPMRVYKGDPDNPDPVRPSHPLNQVVLRPNDYQSPRQIIGLIIASLNIAGNAYVHFVRPNTKSTPEEMWVLRPDRVFVVPKPGNKKELMGFLYVPEGKGYADGTPLLPQDVAHIKFPNPGDRMDGLGYGLSPLSPLARSADVDNSITSFLKLFFDRGTAPMGLLEFEQPLDDPTVAGIKERWMEMYGSFENWSEVGVLDKGGKWTPITPEFNKLGFAEIDERNESRIIGPLGVPGILLGTRGGLKAGTYSNFGEARQQFWEDTFIPELSLIEDELAYFLQADDGKTFTRFDLTHVPALQKNYPQLLQAFQQGVATGITKNAMSDLLGLEFGDMPDGDVIYMSAGLQVVHDPNAPPEPAPVVPPTPGQQPPADQQVTPAAGTAPDASAETGAGAPGATQDASAAGKALEDTLKLNINVSTTENAQALEASRKMAEAALEQTKLLTTLFEAVKGQPEALARVAEQMLSLTEKMGEAFAENKEMLAQQAKALRKAIDRGDGAEIKALAAQLTLAVEALATKEMSPIVVPAAEVTVNLPKQPVLLTSQAIQKADRDKDKRITRTIEETSYQYSEE